jgi:arabinogalactan oligomer/maltooligosaccharide transport system substrate-binding protein
MKKIIALLLALVMVFGMVACGTKTEEPAKTEVENITLTVWGPQEDQADENSFLQKATAAFAAAHPEWNITFKYGVCSEGDAGKNVTQDPAAAADVYMFANDQLGTLIQANAIAKLGGAALEQVKNSNSETMIKSVSDADGNVYGIPFTGNTWFMYYDSSKLTADDIKSLDAMMAKGTVAFPITNTWYLPAFYFANGGTMFGDGTDGSKGINFGGDNGAAVTTYIANAIASGKLIDDANGVGLDGFRKGEVVAMFSGTWDAGAVAEALGENYAAAPLPSITINGEQKQMMSFSGSKALGVNPNSKNPAAAVALAAFLGSAEMQALHFELREGAVIPCDTTLLTDPKFSKNPAAVAQDATIAKTSVLQPSIPEMGAYWSNAESMGKGLANKEVTADTAAADTEKWNNAINGKGGL